MTGGECDCVKCGGFTCQCCSKCPFGIHSPLCSKVCAKQHYIEKHPDIDFEKGWGHSI